MKVAYWDEIKWKSAKMVGYEDGVCTLDINGELMKFHEDQVSGWKKYIDYQDFTVKFNGNSILLSYHAIDRGNKRFGVKNSVGIIKAAFRDKDLKRIDSNVANVLSIINHGEEGTYYVSLALNIVLVVHDNVLKTVYSYKTSRFKRNNCRLVEAKNG